MPGSTTRRTVSSLNKHGLGHTFLPDPQAARAQQYRCFSITWKPTLRGVTFVKPILCRTKEKIFSHKSCNLSWLLAPVTGRTFHNLLIIKALAAGNSFPYASGNKWKHIVPFHERLVSNATRQCRRDSQLF